MKVMHICFVAFSILAVASAEFRQWHPSTEFDEDYSDDFERMGEDTSVEEIGGQLAKVFKNGFFDKFFGGSEKDVGEATALAQQVEAEEKAEEKEANENVENLSEAELVDEVAEVNEEIVDANEKLVENDKGFAEAAEKLVEYVQEKEQKENVENLSEAELVDEIAEVEEEIAEATEEMAEVGQEISEAAEVLVEEYIQEKEPKEAKEEPENLLSDFCRKALSSCQTQTCGGRLPTKNTCDEDASGFFSTECQCSSETGFQQTGAAPASTRSMEDYEFRNMFMRRFGPSFQPFPTLTETPVARQQAMLPIRPWFIQDQRIPHPLFNRLASPFSFSPRFFGENQPDSVIILEGPDEEPEDEGSIIVDITGLINNLSPAAFVRPLFSISMMRIPDDAQEVTFEMEPMMSAEQDGFTVSLEEEPNMMLVREQPMEENTEWMEQEEVPPHHMGGHHMCMLFMLGFLMIISSTICCCCANARSSREEYDETTVDVVGVDAYTPLMETVIQDESSEEQPLMPLDHEEPIKIAKTVV